MCLASHMQFVALNQTISSHKSSMDLAQYSFKNRPAVHTLRGRSCDNLIVSRMASFSEKLFTFFVPSHIPSTQLRVPVDNPGSGQPKGPKAREIDPSVRLPFLIFCAG